MLSCVYLDSSLCLEREYILGKDAGPERLSVFRRVHGEDSILRSFAVFWVFICFSRGNGRSWAVFLKIFGSLE